MARAGGPVTHARCAQSGMTGRVDPAGRRDDNSAVSRRAASAPPSQSSRSPACATPASSVLLGLAALAAAARSPSPRPPSPRCRTTRRCRPRRWTIAPRARPRGATPRPGQTKAGPARPATASTATRTDPQYPRIAGQSERYVAHQLALFKSGERNTGMAAVMKPFADALSAQDMRDIGAYFATQKAGAGVADDTVIAERSLQGHEVLRSRPAAVPQRRRRPRHPGLHGLPRPRRRRQPGPGLPARRRPAAGVHRSAACRNTAPAPPPDSDPAPVQHHGQVAKQR